jgi:hypothetical protein
VSVCFCGMGWWLRRIPRRRRRAGRVGGLGGGAGGAGGEAEGGLHVVCVCVWVCGCVYVWVEWPVGQCVCEAGRRAKSECLWAPGFNTAENQIERARRGGSSCRCRLGGGGRAGEGEGKTTKAQVSKGKKARGRGWM